MAYDLGAAINERFSHRSIGKRLDTQSEVLAGSSFCSLYGAVNLWVLVPSDIIQGYPLPGIGMIQRSSERKSFHLCFHLYLVSNVLL